jgi:ribosomal-protein-serine acetyltransferase
MLTLSGRFNQQRLLRFLEHPHAGELFALLHANREQLRLWHPWVDELWSVAAVAKVITHWRRLEANRQGWYGGLWFQGRLCGMINHQNLDWSNRWSALSYWLDAAHQGRGIMTAGCRALLAHSFEDWRLNRLTIACATTNTRSRALAERLGFTLEGVVREIEWLHDHYADHALYGLLRSEFQPGGPSDGQPGSAAQEPLTRIRSLAGGRT